MDNKPRQNDEELLVLLADIRAGRDLSFACLIEKYDALLRARVSAFGGDVHDMEDAYQEACLALHRAATHYYAQAEVTFGLYAKVCIDNALKTKYKKDGRTNSRRGARLTLFRLKNVGFLPVSPTR